MGMGRGGEGCGIVRTESSGCSNEFTEGMAAIEVGSLVQNLTTGIEKELSCIENRKKSASGLIRIILLEYYL